MIAIFCTVVQSVIQGVALNIEVLPFLKGRVLHESKPRATQTHHCDTQCNTHELPELH
jgi:hypothetical protein